MSYFLRKAYVFFYLSGIQSDIQKVLRHARKLPDKTTQFYKELNRLKRAAVCLGVTFEQCWARLGKVSLKFNVFKA